MIVSALCLGKLKGQRKADQDSHNKKFDFKHDRPPWRFGEARLDLSNILQKSAGQHKRLEKALDLVTSCLAE